MSIVETEEEEQNNEDHKVIPFRLRVISGGRDGSGSWLLAIPDGSYFITRSRLHPKTFRLDLYLKLGRASDTIAVELLNPYTRERGFVDAIVFCEEFDYPITIMEPAHEDIPPDGE